MEKIESADGTVIAFDQIGEGPPIIVVSGAACDRAVDLPIAQALSGHFTVLNYDRRGRGDSGDTLPYAVAREVDDIRALVAAAGGAANVHGLSSGAVLAAEAAAGGLRIDKLIMWEPPFSVDQDGLRRAAAYSNRLTQLLAAERRDDALELFIRQTGAPDHVIAGIRQSPYWQVGLSLAQTLAYDATIMGDSAIPIGRLGQIGAPALVLSGSASPVFLREAATRAAAAIPGGRVAILEGQDHNVTGEAIAPVVAEFAHR